MVGEGISDNCSCCKTWDHVPLSRIDEISWICEEHHSEPDCKYVRGQCVVYPCEIEIYKCKFHCFSNKGKDTYKNSFLTPSRSLRG